MTLDINSFEFPTCSSSSTSMWSIEYTASTRHLRASVSAGPYDDYHRSLREYEFVFVGVENLNVNVAADPFLELKNITSNSSGKILLEFLEGTIEIEAKKYTAKLVKTTPHAKHL